MQDRIQNWIDVDIQISIFIAIVSCECGDGIDDADRADANRKIYFKK